MSELSDFRARKDAFFRSSQSPLAREQRQRFAGLQYFDENPSLRREIKLNKYPDPERIEMATSTGHVAEFLRYGYLSFELNGQPQRLQVYKSADSDELFLPFMDATSGAESYGGGRYLDLAENADGTVLLDFNLSYNPFCAFDASRWSCPLPPSENRLTVPIEAGEKTYSDVED